MSLEFYDITQIAHSDFFFPPEIAIYSPTVKGFVVCRYIEGVAAFGDEGSDVTNTVSRDVEDGAVFFGVGAARRCNGVGFWRAGFWGGCFFGEGGFRGRSVWGVFDEVRNETSRF